MLVGCSSGSSSSGVAGGSPATPVAPAASTPATATAATDAPPSGPYVALGSSFAAGPGITPVDDQFCARSTMDYPHQVATALGLTLVDVTCSAATTDHFTQNQGPKPPQLDAITPDTGLVTINMGGNDIGYSASSLSCSSKAAAGQPCDVPTPAATQERAMAMTAALVSAIQQIQQTAPKAKIYVVTYLDVYPDPARSCPPDNLISDADSAIIAAMGVTLNEATRAAADQTHVSFVDAYAASKGHDVCSGAGQQFVQGAVLTMPGINYHPDPAGEAAYAKVVVDAVRHGS
jgi:hypothetical protein